MANDDKQPMTKGEFRDAVQKVCAGLKQDLENLQAALERKFVHVDAEIPVLTDFGKRLDAMESALTEAGQGGAGVAIDSRAAKEARKKGEAVLADGTMVLFRKPDGGGPKAGIPAIVSGSIVVRPGFPALYSLYVLEPRKHRWEEGIKEGEGAGFFQVRG